MTDGSAQRTWPNRRSVLQGLGAAVPAFALAACGNKPAARDPFTLVIGRPSDSTTLDPLFGTTGADTTINSLVYQRPFRIETLNGVPTGRVLGEAVEQWESDPSGQHWIFHLRKGNFFDDGTPVTAHAIAYSVERSTRANPATIPDLAWLQEIKVLDDHRLSLTLAFPFHSFLFLLSHPLTAIVNPAAVEKHQVNGDYATTWLSEHTAGSGPYRLAKWTRRQRLMLEANPYAGNPPRYFRHVDFRVLPDTSVRVTELSKQNIDVMSGITPEDIPTLGRIPTASLINRASPNLLILTFNLSDPDLADIRMRQAIASAIDYRALVRDVARGQATLVNGPLPQGVLGHDPNLPLPQHNLEKARQHLAAAGYGAQKRLKISMTYSGADTGMELVALALQGNLSQAGIDIALAPLAPAATQQSFATRKYQAGLYRSPIPFPDPFIVMDPLFASYGANQRNANFSGYSDKQTDQLLRQGMTAFADEQIAKAYQAAQRRVLDETPIVVLCASNGFLALSRNIKGLDYSTWLPTDLPADKAIRTTGDQFS